MKRLTSVVLTLTMAFAAFTAASLSSCIRDNVDGLDCPTDGPDPQGRAWLTIDPILDEHRTASTRAYSDWGSDDWGDPDGDPNPNGSTGRAADYKISNFRVLLFDPETELLVKDPNDDSKYYNFVVDATATEAPYKFIIEPGKYDFVFIANNPFHEHHGVSGSNGKYNGITEIDDVLNSILIQDIYIKHDKDLPMITVHEDVDVKAGDDITLGDGTEITGDVWKVKMVRAVVRLSIHFYLAPDQFEQWMRANSLTWGASALPSIQLLVPEHSLFGPNRPISYPGKRGELIRLQEKPADPAAQTELGWYRKNADGSGDIFIDRLIHNESLYADKTDKEYGFKLTMSFDDGKNNQYEKSVTLYRPDPDSPNQPDPRYGYNIPRNTWLWVDGLVRDELEIVTGILPWGDGTVDPGEFMQYNLNVDKDMLVFTDAGSQTVDVFTDHPEGWSIDESKPSTITVTPESDVSGQTTSMTVSVLRNSGSSILSREIYVVAGNMRKKITVITIPSAGISGTGDDPMPANVIPYVGAFWKANQYGERLIRIPRPTVGTLTAIDGDWAAVVIEGEDWIALDTKPSTDAGVWTDNPAQSGNDAGFDALHRVNSSETTVSGKVTPNTPDGIYFRIGLNGRYTPTEEAPARYGVVLLIHKSNGATVMRRIWVRQGEGADYVMYPDDNSGNGVLASRPKAVKYSPYNLTAAEFMGSGATSALGRVDVRPGGAPSVAVPADYPSQSGAFFFHSSTGSAAVHAFNPISYANTGDFSISVSTTPWLTDDSESVHPIGTVRDNHESCPAGYRRPSDGDDTVFLPTVSIDQSEVFQSLFYSPVGGTSDIGGIDNSTWGYYADGFFDRRISGSMVNSVAKYRSTIAIVGRLFYNPEHNNSLFLPFTGRVNNSYSIISRFGELGIYSTSTLSTIDQNRSYWVTELSTTGNIRTVRPVSGAAAIRCVEVPPPPPITKLEFQSNPLIVSYMGWALGGTYNVSVDTDATSWTAEVVDPAEHSWVQITDIDVESRFITLAFPPPYYGDEYGNTPDGGYFREAQIVLKAGGRTSDPFTIRQYAALWLDAPSLGPSGGVVLGPNTNGDGLAEVLYGEDVMIHTNGTNTYVESSPDWLSVDYNSYGTLSYYLNYTPAAVESGKIVIVSHFPDYEEGFNTIERVEIPVRFEM